MAYELMRLVYTSSHWGISKDQFVVVSEEAKGLHADLGISGVIVVGEEDFLVVIEGEPLIVTQALTHIAKDDRHDDVTVLLAGSVSDRLYRGWKTVELGRVISDANRLSGYTSVADFNPRDMTRDQLESMVHDLSYAA